MQAATPTPTTARLLLDIVELLGSCTSDLESLTDIPRMLVSALPLDRAGLDITVQEVPESGRVLVSALFEAPTGFFREPRPTVDHFHGQSGFLGHPFSEAAPPAGVSDPFDAWARPINSRGDAPIEYHRQLDDHHRMKLVLHWGKRLTQMSVDLRALLDAVNEVLGRSLQTLFSTRGNPALLGGEFAELTQRQWQILCRLSSAHSEKQLADSLQLSRNTLHGHIKSIYRKLGVCGRLEAVRRVDQAIRYYRAGIHAGSCLRVTDACAAAPDVPRSGLTDDARGREPVGKRISVARDCLRRMATARS